MDSSSSKEQFCAFSPLETFLATTTSSTMAAIKDNKLPPSSEPKVVEEKLNSALMALTVLRGRFAGLSQNMDLISTTVEQIAKDIHDMKHEPKSLSDEQVRRLINDIVPQLPAPRGLPEETIDIMRSLDRLPRQLYERLNDCLSARKVEFAEMKQAFDEILERQGSSERESLEARSIAKERQILELLQDLVTTRSTFGATAQNAQPLLPHSAETLNIQFTMESPAAHNDEATIGIHNGREKVMYSKHNSETTSKEDLSNRPVPMLSRQVVHADNSLLEICLPEHDRSFPANNLQTGIRDREPEYFMSERSGILQKLNRVEDKLDRLLATNKPSGNDMCHLDDPKERSPSGFLNSRDVPKKTAISSPEELKPQDLLCGPEGDAQNALRESRTSPYNIDLINSEFPPLIPGRSDVQVMAFGSMLDKPQAPECAVTQGQVESEQTVSAIQPPLSQTRSQDRGSITAPSKRRRLIGFSSEDEEDEPEAMKRFRSGISSSHDTETSRMQNHGGSESQGKQISSCSTATTEKLEADGAEHPNAKANSGFPQNRRRISVSPDLL